MLKTFINKIFSVRMGALYILLFAIAIAVATFIENDYGTSAAQKVVFKARWFEVLLLLFAGSIVNNIIVFKMISQKKWASLIFHSSIILILLGSAVTRYFGYEGMMHIREGSANNEISSAETYLNFKFIKDDKSYSFEEPILISSLGKNTFNKSYQIADKVLKIKLLDVVPNPVERIIEDPNGKAIVKLVVAGGRGREEYFLEQGNQQNYAGMLFNFSDVEMPGHINIKLTGDSLFVNAPLSINRMVMATRQTDTLQAGVYHPLLTRALHSMGNSNFVVSEYSAGGNLVTISKERKIKNESTTALQFEIDDNGKKHLINALGVKGAMGQFAVVNLGDAQFGISYGSKMITLPFSLHLRDFILDKYPGTDNPASYASEVTLQDTEKGINREQRIYMNHVLDHRGFRFFQSSFDQDELGTYLSVNHDFWGTWISYIGYGLFTIGLLLIFFFKNTRFAFLMNKLNTYQRQTNTWIILVCLSGLLINNLNAQSNPPTSFVNKEHADKFGKCLVQDFEGRFKPLNTLSNELLRKISKKESNSDLSSEQVILSMVMSPEHWEKVDIIDAGKHPEIHKLLNAGPGLVSYRSFFHDDGAYKLKEYVRTAQTMNPKDQGTFEKAVIKLDEKVNISNMIFSARIFRILPVPNDPNNTWISPADAQHTETKNMLPEFVQTFFPIYLTALQNGYDKQDFSAANSELEKLVQYQQTISNHVIPSVNKQTAELLLNEWKIFAKLRNIYALFGLGMLIFFIYNIITHKFDRIKLANILFYILLVPFILHTIGLALRWYVSGHAPWSNGYESMIYIAWTTMLAGIIFSRKSLGGLAATCILAATILLVAGMSWMDPEITPLVPVLKSYWLTIHVSLEAGSYGFLMLGAVIGMLNLLLMILTTAKNIDRMKRSIEELSIISEITVTGGLIMVSVGTYLGGIWANESWGRYWGWDAKETWALVTILVYAFILHMRFIPNLMSTLAYNIATLFGFATVIMTYYGVNYYLSGLHSYAAGDPVPIPPVVYNTAIVLIILAVLAAVRYRKLYKE